jgi:hypothetical protein
MPHSITQAFRLPYRTPPVCLLAFANFPGAKNFPTPEATLLWHCFRVAFRQNKTGAGKLAPVLNLLPRVARPATPSRD